MKTITFAVPCYNSEEYMDKCIESLLACGDDVEIIIVDDGSTKDNTAAKADEWQERFPDIIRSIHQENGGHGVAINTALQHCKARYFKVVDSDDWLDPEAMKPVMAYLRRQMELREPTDLIITNYVYEKVFENTRTVIKYNNVFPVGREFTWDEVGSFSPSKYLLMHSVIYRSDLLLDMNLQLPDHCFYVDNIFVYQPLPHVKTMYYFDVDLYHYFIGREDQSVNESVMVARIDHQLRITKIMIDAVDVLAIPQKRLRNYMENYLSMMMCICTVFLRMNKTEENEIKREEIWSYLKNKNEVLYRRIRSHVVNLFTNLPTAVGRYTGLSCYRLARRIFKFN